MHDKATLFPKAQELVIGLVGAVGTDLELVAGAVQETLAQLSYKYTPIRLSELLHEIGAWQQLAERPYDERLEAHMTAGTKLRETCQRGDALAMLAIGAIRSERENLSGDVDKPADRHTYVLRSLKHPAEVETLRRIYGPAFILIAAYSPRSARRRYLVGKIADSRGKFQSEEFNPVAEQLIQRDESEAGTTLGQHVRGTFPMADVFIDASDPQGLRDEVMRFFKVLFDYPFHTPRRDEYAMFHAQAAGLRSASLARQVGATVSTEDGDIVAVGTNEVPRGGGGLYWEGDPQDQRDFVWGYDTSDRYRRNLLADALYRLLNDKEEAWISAHKTREDVDKLVERVLTGEPSPLTGAYLMNVIEFVRAVHAEMAALVDAARRGASVRGCTLYTTTFPCHDCAKHIVAAGIRRVVYVHPYPKSLAAELHPDSISLDTASVPPGQVRFEPFVGIAPRLYMDLFAGTGERKDRSGNTILWNPTEALPKMGESVPLYWARLNVEGAEFQRFVKDMEARGLQRIPTEEGKSA